MNKILPSKFRYHVILATRKTVPTPGTGVPVVQYVNQRKVYADIQPLSRYVMLNSFNAGKGEVTHELTIRYHDIVEMYDCILRLKAINPDGSKVYERYHLAGGNRVDGRRRFMQFDLKLEQELVTFD